jgi:two-component system, cell cycle response regulator DivK
MSKILLVEDEEDMRNILVRRLQRRGYELVTTDDGMEVSGLAQSSRPDLILMDLRLEKSGSLIDGLEATRRLKADPTTRSIPVIILTADAVGDKEQQCQQAGCDDYEVKPIVFPQLLEKIETHLGKRTAS